MAESGERGLEPGRDRTGVGPEARLRLNKRTDLPGLTGWESCETARPKELRHPGAAPAKPRYSTRRPPCVNGFRLDGNAISRLYLRIFSTRVPRQAARVR